MPTPVVVVFYAWPAVSVVGLGYRLATRGRRRSAAAPATERERPVRTESARASAAAPSTSLMEALTGISMPCDLVPLTSVEGRDLTGRDLLLTTTGHRPQDVGRAMGAAVAALGYSVTPTGAHAAVAARGTDRITMVVHDRPDTVLVGKHRAFPTTTADDVVVELRL